MKNNKKYTIQLEPKGYCNIEMVEGKNCCQIHIELEQRLTKVPTTSNGPRMLLPVQRTYLLEKMRGG